MRLVLADSLRRAERLYGRREGVVCGEARLTYAAFGARCRRLAAGLRRLGVRRGDRVAVLMANCHRYLEAYTAIPGLGAVIVPLNTRHALTEHQAILADCGPRLLIVDTAHRHLAEALAPAVETVLPAPEDYERLVTASAEVE
ncbi:MAG: AMP-binding protein, partial [Chloroflexota bacterium]